MEADAAAAAHRALDAVQRSCGHRSGASPPTVARDRHSGCSLQAPSRGTIQGEKLEETEP
ncbi:hypothetical protein EJB05_09377, partial [Eragrostis curvula]